MGALRSFCVRSLQRLSTASSVSSTAISLPLGHSSSAASPPLLQTWQRFLSSKCSQGESTGSVGNVQRFEFSRSPWMAVRQASFAAQLPGLHLGQKEGPTSQQVRSVMVEVIKDDLERAMRKMKRRMKDDGSIRLLRERQSFRKPSELKVLARKERDKRIAKRAFKEKLKWIQNQRSRGF